MLDDFFDSEKKPCQDLRIWAWQLFLFLTFQGPILPETLQRLILLSEAHAPSCRVRVHTQEDTISFTLFNSPEDQVLT